ncbi:MAG: hypothetical protein ABGZ53_14240 [Fuerstiella sp.]
MIKEAPQVDPQVVARQAQVRGLAVYVLRHFDINENGVIERAEFQKRSSQFRDIASADNDRNGEVGPDEIATWLHRRLPPLSRLNMELQAHDLNHDDQVTFHEFSSVSGHDAVDEFGRWDRNGDGFITPGESYLSGDPTSTYQNSDAFVIKPGASVVSDIWIEDDVSIDRLQVYVCITKDGDNWVAVSLVSREGKRVPLYAGDGW